jgi:opacity protein-like surface antigen
VAIQISFFHRQRLQTAKAEWEASGGKSISDSTLRRFLKVLTEDINALDFGLTLGAGVEYKAFFLRLEYDWGLSNLLNDAGDYSSKTRNFGISIGYSFILK